MIQQAFQEPVVRRDSRPGDDDSLQRPTRVIRPATTMEGLQQSNFISQLLGLPAKIYSGWRCGVAGFRAGGAEDASMSLQPGTPVLYLLYMPDIRPSRLGHPRRLFLLLDTVQQLIRPDTLSAHPDPPTSIRSPPLDHEEKKRKEIVSPRFSSTNEMDGSDMLSPRIDHAASRFKSANPDQSSGRH